MPVKVEDLGAAEGGQEGTPGRQGERGRGQEQGRGGHPATPQVLTAEDRRALAEHQRTVLSHLSEEDAAVLDPVARGAESLERWARAAQAAARGAPVTDVMRELREDGDEEELEEKAPAKTEAEVEVKAEAVAKGEPVATAALQMEQSVEEPSGLYPPPVAQPDYGYGFGYGGYGEPYSYEYQDPYATETEAEEEVETVPERSPSGFIIQYTGPETRRSERSTTGWHFGAPPGTDEGYGSRSPVRWSVPSKPVAPTRVPPATNRPVMRPKSAGSSVLPGKRAPFYGVPSAGRMGPSGLAVGPRVLPQRTPAQAQPRTATVPRGVPPRGVAPPPSLASQRPGMAGSLSAFGLSTLVSNAVKVLPCFYSDTATVERARDFWELFQDHTDGLPDQSRLLVFRQKLKGREAERWWNNSRIKTFATLKVRFHNQFLSQTADELWERLKTTKRERGESVEEWGDRVSSLCESLDYPSPQMRYQLFKRGIRNKRMLAALDASPATDIPEACMWLMSKDMHRPIEEDDEFSDSESEKKKSSTGSMSVDALAQQLQSFMEQQQRWQESMMQSQYQVPRLEQNRVAATQVAPPAGMVADNGRSLQGNGAPFRGIRMDDDSRTQDGAPVCGRCYYKGHGRAVCKRQQMTCRSCGQFGHIGVECDASPSGAGRTFVYTPDRRQTGACFFCSKPGHTVAGCPALQAMRAMLPQVPAAAAPQNQAASRE